MNTNWRPIVRGRDRVDIPVVVRYYDPAAFDRWKGAQERWQASSRTDHSAWGEYACLTEGGRIRFPNGGQAAHGFGEAHTALWLHKQGFMCWRPLLFDYGKTLRPGFRLRVQDEVRSYWDTTRFGPWPADVQRALDFVPRSPDVVGYHPKRKEWRFCEVKRARDRVALEQVQALALLHLITGAPAAIIRVMPEGTAVVGEYLPVRVPFTPGVRTPWNRWRELMELNRTGNFRERVT